MRRREKSFKGFVGVARPRRLDQNPLLTSFRVALVVLALLACIRVAAATERVRAFDVPAGDAVDTLRLAARQAELEIVFFAETVQGVRTTALRGEFPPREGLERLVAGTGLRLVGDAPGRTLTVRREPVRMSPADPPPLVRESPMK